MIDYTTLIELLLKRGDSGDIGALNDCMTILKQLEMENSITVTALKRELPDTVVYDTDNFKQAHAANKDLRAVCRKLISKGINADKALALYWQTHLFDAPHEFDSFMLYIERNRPKEQQFWLPRREKLMHVCRALQKLEDNELDELFLSMPPRVGKTTLMVFFVLWCILRNSELSNLYTSYTDSVVGVFYNGLLEILQDPITYAWREVFPHATIASTNAKDQLLNIDRKKRYCSFTGRSLYGTLNGACDCNGKEIADDLISGIEESMSRDRLDSAWLKVDNNYLPRAKEGAKRLWIGTRWATADPQGRRLELLETDPRFKNIRWEQINTPALDENDNSNFDYAYGVGFSSEYFIQRRASFERNNDMASWFAQYQGVPVDRVGSVFEPDDMRYYNGVLPNEIPDRVFMAVDPAWGGGDFVAAPVCVQYGEDIYVPDVVYDNHDKRITIPLIVKAVADNGVTAVRCEGTRVTSSYGEEVSKKLKELGLSVNVQSSVANWTFNGKEQRIFDKAPDIREHFIFLESAKRGKAYKQFMDNVFSFKIGGKNKHDDAPDSLAMAVDMTTRTVQKSIIMKRFF